MIMTTRKQNLDALTIASGVTPQEGGRSRSA